MEVHCVFQKAVNLRSIDSKSDHEKVKKQLIDLNTIIVNVLEFKIYIDRPTYSTIYFFIKFHLFKHLSEIQI